ncbi:TPA: hypothetical protein PXD14_006458, partial [Pseudomonas aeruginosa]|nr:hypothetical protein [Pseudomonas aeruginosa]
MNKANECTCPSGDGSLRWPCPKHPAVEQAGANVGHGHVFPRADGVKMRCGGPGLCSECTADASRARAALAQPSPAQAEQHWPKLEKPAQVGAIRFRAGLSSRLVVEAAQRLYEFESTPEKEAERIERLQAFREQCFEPLGAEFSKVLSENLVELSSEAKPEQAEAERPEVVGYRTVGRHAKHQHPHYALNYYKQNAEDQAAHWREVGCEVSEDELMTVAQHERIVGALRAVITQLHQHKKDYMDAGQETYRALQNEIREREAEIARLDGLVSVRTAERDAALAEVERIKTISDNYYVLCVERQQQLDAALARVAELEAELETERMRLSACATAALGYFDGCADAYKSASLSDVLRLRGDCDAALAEIAELEKKLAMALDAASKGDAARHAACGMEMEIQELKAKLAEIAGDFLPDNSGQAELALNEMRQALHELLGAA